MPIAMSRYVEISSGVGAGAAVGVRELIGRFFTTNPLIPTGSVLEFTSADDVGTYFGFASVEYLRALFYFSWISKNITQPQKISFARWANSAVGSEIFGKPATYVLGTFTAITAGDFTLTLDGHTSHLTGIDLHACASLAAVATAIQAAINAITAGGAAWTAATVSFDATRGCFNLVSGSTGVGTVVVLAGSSTDLAAPLGWLTGAILSNGAAQQTITQLLSATTQLSNNFGSFAFIPSLTSDQVVEAATWNKSQNVLFQYSIPCSAGTASALSAALINLGGCELTLSPLSNEYPEQVPMMILAATDYSKRNSVQDYMFQIFDLTASVTTNANADIYDALRVNYYGLTQTAGQLLQFYQRGVMMGLATDPVDQNTYANEQWLKDAAGAALMALLLSLAQIPANKQGRAQILAQLQSIIDLAIFNGTVSIGKPLNAQQKLYITNASGDAQAWQQVQNIGYWVDCVIQSFVVDSVTQWKAIYTLIYSKDDVIRKIEGTHVLI